MYTQMQLAHTLVHHCGFEGSRCGVLTEGRCVACLSRSLSLSLSVGPGAGHCKGQRAGDGKGQQCLLPWGRTRHIIRLMPHTGKRDLASITHTHTHAHACTKAKQGLASSRTGWTCECLRSCLSLCCYIENI